MSERDGPSDRSKSDAETGDGDSVRTLHVRLGSMSIALSPATDDATIRLGFLAIDVPIGHRRGGAAPTVRGVRLRVPNGAFALLAPLAPRLLAPPLRQGRDRILAAAPRWLRPALEPLLDAIGVDRLAVDVRLEDGSVMLRAEVGAARLTARLRIAARDDGQVAIRVAEIKLGPLPATFLVEQLSRAKRVPAGVAWVDKDTILIDPKTLVEGLPIHLRWDAPLAELTVSPEAIDLAFGQQQ